MTNEEAIKNLSFAKQVEDMLGEFGGGVKSSDLSKSLAMAIEALQQQPCEDAVSRQALIECINHEEENFKSDHMESISSGEEDPFVDGVLSGIFGIRQMITQMPPVKPCEDMGEVSDGYHTFNQLYHQRAVLFATIVNQNKDKSWKSFKHSGGNYCFDSNGEWFIVGIDTPQGSYTYHYAKEYWDMFDCEELECGKEWDGHTEEDVTRLLSLQNEPCEDCIRQFQKDMTAKMESEE